MPRMKRSSIREAIVVEGRDDVTVVEQAVDTLILATHGFGITAETWGLIEKAYNERGIIILTDPDFSGEEIRRRLTERFPRAKQAYLPRQKAIKGDDIGVENATPVDVLEAIESAHATKESAGEKNRDGGACQTRANRDRGRLRDKRSRFRQARNRKM